MAPRKRCYLGAFAPGVGSAMIAARDGAGAAGSSDHSRARVITFCNARSAPRTGLPVGRLRCGAQQGLDLGSVRTATSPQITAFERRGGVGEAQGLLE